MRKRKKNHKKYKTKWLGLNKMLLEHNILNVVGVKAFGRKTT